MQHAPSQERLKSIFRSRLFFVLFTVLFTLPACKSSTQRVSTAPEVSALGSIPSRGQAFVGEGCSISGCSSHVCGAAGEPIITTCLWKEEYICYKTARCEKQASGQCGWTTTPELSRCLTAARSGITQ
jgi:hypothetical protein